MRLAWLLPCATVLVGCALPHPTTTLDAARDNNSETSLTDGPGPESADVSVDRPDASDVLDASDAFDAMDTGEAAVEPGPEPMPEPMPEPGPEAGPEPMPEPMPEPGPEPMPEPAPEAGVDAGPEADTGPVCMPVAGSCNDGCRVGLYQHTRVMASAVTDVLYTTNPTESGYQASSPLPVMYVYSIMAQAPAGAVALLSCVNAGHHVTALTCSGFPGYSMEATLGFVVPPSLTTCGATPALRVYCGTNNLDYRTLDMATQTTLAAMPSCGAYAPFFAAWRLP